VLAFGDERKPGSGGEDDFHRAGPAINIQLMVKDSKKYASTGGWDSPKFKHGKPADEALHKTCFPCHECAKASDVFTDYSPQHRERTACTYTDTY
jgi:hypothetical protein